MSLRRSRNCARICSIIWKKKKKKKKKKKSIEGGGGRRGERWGSSGERWEVGEVGEKR